MVLERGFQLNYANHTTNTTAPEETVRHTHTEDLVSNCEHRDLIHSQAANHKIGYITIVSPLCPWCKAPHHVLSNLEG